MTTVTTAVEDKSSKEFCEIFYNKLKAPLIESFDLAQSTKTILLGKRQVIFSNHGYRKSISLCRSWISTATLEKGWIWQELC